MVGGANYEGAMLSSVIRKFNDAERVASKLYINSIKIIPLISGTNNSFTNINKFNILKPGIPTLL